MYGASTRQDRAALIAAEMPSGYYETVQDDLSWTRVPMDTHVVRGVATYYNLQRRSRLPHAWAVVYGAAMDAIVRAFEHDSSWATATIGSSGERAVATALGTTSSLVEHGNLVVDATPHVSAKVFCDAYQDLFEGSLAALARVYVPLREVRRPGRRGPDALSVLSGRELFEILNSGSTWEKVLVPFDPFYRNAFAHRSISIDSQGSVEVSSQSGEDVRHLSREHLIAVLHDANQVVTALTAALELRTVRGLIIDDLTSIDAREAFGWFVLPLQQRVMEWGWGGVLLKVTLRGSRSEGSDLLRAVLGFMEHVTAPQLRGIALAFESVRGARAGHWVISDRDLRTARATPEGFEKVVREAKAYQLRL